MIAVRPGRTALALVCVVVAVFGVACSLVLFGVKGGVVPPLEARIDLGIVGVRTLVIDDPACRSPIPAGSIAAMCSPRTLFATNRYYSVWLETRRRVAGRTRSEFRRVLLLRLPS